ncbi:MAG TPA: TolC family protein [Caulobacteraceae bacterium]|nr:TolC family protein [Caulobacteraceae bacterium]
MIPSIFPHRRLRTGLAAAGLLAAACPALARDRDAPPQVALPAAFAGAPSGAPLAPAALDQWWRLFHDPTLDALEDEAFRVSPDARTAQARILEARATRRGQIAGTLPSGGVSANLSHQAIYGPGAASDLSTSTGVVNEAQGGFDISWEIDLFGRLAARRRIARAADAEARFDVEGTRAALAAAVADAWFQAQGLAIELADAQATVRIEHGLLDIAQRKSAAGAGPDDAIDRVAAEAQADEARVVDLDAQLDDARRQLLILVGRDLTRLADLKVDGQPPAVPPAPAALPAQLLARRPDVREAEYHLRAQLGAATLAHRAIFPTITLLPALGGSSIAAPGVSFIPPSTIVSQQQTTTTGFWTLAAGVSMPILDIPRLLDEAHAQDARSRQAAIAYEKTVRTAFGEAQDALVDLSAGERASALLASSETHARLAYDASRRRYGEGLDDLTATLTAEQSWRTIRSSLTAERVDTLRRAVRTYKALGGGWAYGAQAVG